jgi:disulfide bond formation protein DsbB
MLPLMLAPLLRHWPFAALLASVMMLAAAHVFEYLGYQPCLLCLKQREVYWAAIAVAGAAIAARRLLKGVTASVLVSDVLLGLVFLTGMVVAVYHAGAEWKFWPGPSTCAAAGSLNPADILDALDRPIHPPSCEDAAWRLAGISMAGYNALISAGLAGISLLAAFAPRTGDDLGRND